MLTALLWYCDSPIAGWLCSNLNKKYNCHLKFIGSASAVAEVQLPENVVENDWVVCVFERVFANVSQTTVKSGPKYSTLVLAGCVDWACR